VLLEPRSEQIVAHGWRLVRLVGHDFPPFAGVHEKPGRVDRRSVPLAVFRLPLIRHEVKHPIPVPEVNLFNG
jgi:hypothetical protein